MWKSSFLNAGPYCTLKSYLHTFSLSEEVQGCQKSSLHDRHIKIFTVLKNVKIFYFHFHSFAITNLIYFADLQR